ncbi:hypothetical protein Tco_1106276 [Tanacetum coccineum]
MIPRNLFPLLDRILWTFDKFLNIKAFELVKLILHGFNPTVIKHSFLDIFQFNRTHSICSSEEDTIGGASSWSTTIDDDDESDVEGTYYESSDESLKFAQFILGSKLLHSEAIVHTEEEAAISEIKMATSKSPSQNFKDCQSYALSIRYQQSTIQAVSPALHETNADGRVDGLATHLLVTEEFDYVAICSSEEDTIRGASSWSTTVDNDEEVWSLSRVFAAELSDTSFELDT